MLKFEFFKLLFLRGSGGSSDKDLKVQGDHAGCAKPDPVRKPPARIGLGPGVAADGEDARVERPESG